MITLYYVTDITEEDYESVKRSYRQDYLDSMYIWIKIEWNYCNRFLFICDCDSFPEISELCYWEDMRGSVEKYGDFVVFSIKFFPYSIPLNKGSKVEPQRIPQNCRIDMIDTVLKRSWSPFQKIYTLLTLFSIPFALIAIT